MEWKFNAVKPIEAKLKKVEIIKSVVQSKWVLSNFNGTNKTSVNVIELIIADTQLNNKVL